MLLAFVSEGVCVEGFNGVAKFNDAYGIEALDLSEASGCCLRCGMVFWVILQVIGIGEAMDNEHVRAEEGTFSIRDSRKDPLGKDPLGKDPLKERKKETQQRGLRDRVNPTLVPAIRIPGPREQTYTTETRSLVGIRREGSTRAEV